MDTILLCGMVAVGSAVISSLLTRALLKRRLMRKALDELACALEDVTELSIDTFNTLCPKCCYSKNGNLCDNPDLENICRYGQCVRFEERRF